MVLSTLMSKGPGKTQRAIAALIEAEPEGAWPIEELARLIYGAGGHSEKSAIGRALQTMRLPGTWVVMQASFRNDRRFWLYDPCELDSWRKIAEGFDPSHFHPGGVVFGWWETAKQGATPRT